MLFIEGNLHSLNITETKRLFLDELVKDCITYRLTENEAMQYIESRFKRISVSSYKHRKAKLLNENESQIWLEYFTRIGFVETHKKHIEDVQRLQNDSMYRFYEMIQDREKYDDEKVLKLKHDIRENIQLLSDLGLGTPIISAIKSKLEHIPKTN